MRGGQEGPSKKLSALKWGSECTSSRQIPGGSIQQPPRRLPGLRCETRTCPLQALLCEGTQGSSHGSRERPARNPAGELSQNLRSPRLACLTLLPQTWIFTAHSSLCPPPPALYPKVAAFGVGGGRWEGGWKAARTPGAGPTPYHILPHPGRTVWQEGCFVSSLAGVGSSSQGGSSLGLQASMGGRGAA